MQWLVLGAGALGGYFGARLVEAGESVTFLVHARRRAQLAKTGLVVKSPKGDAHVAAPHCVDAEHAGGRYDVVLLGCKAYDLDAAMEAIAPAIGPDTAILPVLNGMRHIDRLRERFGAGHVLGGMCQISAALDGDGRVQHFNDLDTLAYGELDGTNSKRMQAIRAVLERANFTARASDDVLQEMWEKWIFIAAMAGATCLFRASIGDIVQAGAVDLATGMLAEGAAIATTNGHAPRAVAFAQMRQFLTNPASVLTASMLKDVERGARTEGTQILDELVAHVSGDSPTPRLLEIAAASLRAYELRRMRRVVAG